MTGSSNSLNGQYNMGIGNTYCNSCNHECHCDNLVCSEPVGVGMTDESDSCGCGVCECIPNRANSPRD
jgi:hypothetical protein